MRDNVLVSLDIGNGYVKARGPNGSAVSFPSVLAEMNDNLDGFNFSLDGSDRFVIGYRGKRYAVGDTVYFDGMTPVTIAHRSRIQMDYYRVLFAAALSEVAVESARIEAVVSLPPAAYWDKEQQKSVLSGVYDVRKLGNVGTSDRHYTMDIGDIRVIPEGLGSVCTMALDTKGGESRNSFLAHTRVGIVDVGTYTTDLIMLDSLRIVRSGCETMTTALHSIHQRLVTYVSSCGVDLQAYRADDTLHRGYFLSGGRRVSLLEARDAWMSELATAVSAQIRTTWNGGNDVEFIVVTGGGAPLIERLLQMEFPHVQLIDSAEPYFANCEGGYRYGLLRQRAEKSRGR